MKSFGKLSRAKFQPPRPTRGGGYNPDKVKEPPLTGKVQGLKAAKGEERMARVLNKKMNAGNVRGYYFRSSPGLPKGVPGWKELDFEIFTISGNVAVSVEGATFVHHGESKRNQDMINEVLIMERLRMMGRPVPRIERIFDYQLETEADAEKALKKIGIR